MADTEETPTINQGDAQSDTDIYLAEIEKLKNETVSKDEYEKIKKERDEAVHRMATERPVAQTIENKEPTPQEKYDKIKKNAEEMAKGELNGLEYAERLVENNKLMKDLNIAPLTTARNVSSDMIEQNEKVNELLEQCIKDANGNPSEFDRLMRLHTR